ncbi:hypothetical protein HK098_005713 [Nowakowskiella sp. JEL0407]|nr:hypothetical protein HK098_005713 [Nowakowskiella sp. JEL0407]
MSNQPNFIHRPFKELISSFTTLEGGGFTVRRPFPTPRYQQIDPFLLLDEMGPVTYEPGEAKGAPDHPHRGFETVTYVLDGEMEHRDSTGNAGKLKKGSVQWMTAGSGIIHREMPSKNMIKNGGRMHGFQLWINLPQSEKMIDPFYQEYDSHKLPKILLPPPSQEITTSAVSSEPPTSSIVVVSGSTHGVTSPISTKIPCVYLHYTIIPGDSVDYILPTEWTKNGSEFTIFGYVFKNTVVFGDVSAFHDDQLQNETRSNSSWRAGESLTKGLNPETKYVHVSAGQLVLFSKTHDLAVDGGGASVSGIKMTNVGTETAEVLLLGAKPLNEPMARQGPFVMNTRAEIEQAYRDFYSGKMGKIKGKVVN